MGRSDDLVDDSADSVVENRGQARAGALGLAHFSDGGSNLLGCDSTFDLGSSFVIYGPVSELFK